MHFINAFKSNKCFLNYDGKMGGVRRGKFHIFNKIKEFEIGCKGFNLISENVHTFVLLSKEGNF